MRGVGDQYTGIRILDIRCHLRPGQTEVQRHEDRTEAGAREECEQEDRLVQADESHAIAPSYPEPVQPAGELFDTLLHVRVAPCLAFECQRSALRGTQRALLEPVGQANVGSAHALGSP
jgi:hypothetical protein